MRLGDALLPFNDFKALRMVGPLSSFVAGQGTVRLLVYSICGSEVRVF